MDAIILAAGKGTRLQPHTNTTPKPLLPVRGRPILDWIIGALPPVDRLVVVVNYLAEQTLVQNWVTVRQAVPRGTGDALMSCKGAVSARERVMVLNGDDLIGRADLTKLAQVPMGILAHPVQAPESFGIIFRNPDGTLKQIVEKPKGLSAPQLANIGGYLFPGDVFSLTLPLSPRGEYEITDAVSQLAERGGFQVVEADYWLPIGTVEQWRNAQKADVSAAK
jgi:bifunctional UDP-N-acetylglucosamine pyrophosphorylase/glucosamine-1-phosphate N-acetyltransferase